MRCEADISGNSREGENDGRMVFGCTIWNRTHGYPPKRRSE
jgi:hypothetical protein